MSQFKLHYHITNNGDGSASINLHPTAEAAAEADANMDEGWGEPCNGDVTLKIEDGRLYYQEYELVDDKYQYVWHPVEAVA